MLQFNQVTLSRGDRTLFERLDLTVHPGHKVGVVGRNGVGKTTLFELVRGRLLPEEGDVVHPEGWRLAWLEQTAPPSSRGALDYVLDGDVPLRSAERAIARADETHDNEALAHAWSDFGDAGGYDAEARAGEILHGLGFEGSDFKRPHGDFSGGWRIRLQLARALMTPSDLLLLDEPTNHLDMDTTLWLESWIRRYQGTLLTIAHDREFLDRTVSEIVHLEQLRANVYVGNYASFERQRAEALTRQAQLYRRQQEEVERIHRFVDRFRAKASKARQVQSRLKALDRMDRVAAVHAEAGYHFSFTNPRKTSYPTISLDEVTLGYGETVVLDGVTLRVSPEDRIGILGANGAGKTTLLRCLAREMQPMAGTMTRGRHDSVGYFAQHQLESLDLARSPLDHLIDAMGEQRARDYLGGWGFTGEDIERSAATFSGGEKARLVLALIATTEPAVLVLDEPTNHLDLDMRQALAHALREFNGALLLVSHDRHLLRQCVDQFWLVRDGRVRRFEDDLSAYEALISARSDVRGGRGAGSDDRHEAKQARNRLRGLERRERQLAGEIERIGGAVAELERELADPATYRKGAADIEELVRRQGRARRELERAEQSWLDVQEALDQ